MVVGGVVSMLPFEGSVVKAPPAAGTLNVTWESLAPETNTFQGDVNLSLLWLALKAEGADITLESIKVDVWGLPSQGINRTFAWDDRNGDKEMSYAECIIAEDVSSPYILPPAGQMKECTWPGPGVNVVINQNKTRYFTIYLDLDFDPDQKFTDRDLYVCVNNGHITSSAADVIGLPACSRTIDVNRRFFFDDMEHGQGDWTFTGGDSGGVHPNGLWHLSQGEEDCMNNPGGLPFYHSANTSWWYGHRYYWFDQGWACNYYTHEAGNPVSPTRNWGRLRTPWIDATKGTSLAMKVWHYLTREQYEGVDLAQIYLNNGVGWHFISSEWTTDSHWKKLALNLSEYAGQRIQLEFRFDTVDSMNNLFWGWFIDDLVVYGEVLAHDISVTQLGIGDYVSLDPQVVTAQINNIGANNENNIDVNLTVDGAVVDQTTISFLASGANTTVGLSWTPSGEGTYQVCVESAPVPGETVLWNNQVCKSVTATSQTYTKVVILRSYGTQVVGPKTTWDYLNNNWGNHGSDPIQIDYVSLNINPITYEMINNTQADVLVLSGSGYYHRPPIGTELSDEETAAIEKWTREGHGFVAIGTAFHQLVPNNNDLADLVGIVDQPYARDFTTDIQVDGGCLGHPIFDSVPNVFQSSFGSTAAPNDDHSWGAEDLDGAQYCARSTGNQSSAITVFKGSVYIAFAADAMPNEDEKQLLYNTFVWSRFQAYDYDVKVTDINVPRFVRPGYDAKVSSVLSNIGKKDLASVQVDLKVDGTPVDTQTINNLIHAEWSWANFTWIPSTVGNYEICVFAAIVGHTDEDLSNNEDCMNIEVTNNPPVQVYILDSWGTDFAHLAPWDYLNANWNNHGSVPVFIDYTRFNIEGITYQELVDSYADVLLISSSKSGRMGNPVLGGYLFTNDEMNAIIQYTQEGHGLIATGLTFDSNRLPQHGSILGPLFGLNPLNVYTHLNGIKDLHVLDPTENHPLFNSIAEYYNTGDGTTLTPGFLADAENWTVAHLAGGEYKALSTPTENAAVIAYEPGAHNSVYISNFVENGSNANDKQLLYNAMVWGRTSIDSPTDLWIYKAGNSLRLEWIESTSPKVQGYRIYRATTVNGFDFNNAYDTVPAGTNQWTDSQPDVGVDSSNYFYLVRAYDEKGNEEMNLNKVGKFVKQLYKGTNEISIGFELKDHTTSVAFESVAGLYKSIEAHDPNLCIWKAWTPTGGALTQIDRTMGLRVRMRSDAMLINVGRVVRTSITITNQAACDSWNFVGYPSFATKTLPGVLDNHGMTGKYDMVMYYDAADKKAKWKFFDPNDPGGSTLTELSPGMGIWIHAVQAGTWEVEGD